jgi:hypothetical protein
MLQGPHHFWGAMMGRIGRTYPRPGTWENAAMPKRPVLFLAQLTALRHRLHRARPVVWLCLLIGL